MISKSIEQRNLQNEDQAQDESDDEIIREGTIGKIDKDYQLYSGLVLDAEKKIQAFENNLRVPNRGKSTYKSSRAFSIY